MPLSVYDLPLPILTRIKSKFNSPPPAAFHTVFCGIYRDSFMIKSFRHKGLRKYFEVGSLAGIQPVHANRLKMQLAALDTAQTIEDMNIPGFRLHPLKGGEQGRWSIWVNGNWRVTFEFENGNAFILDYEDYH